MKRTDIPSTGHLTRRDFLRLGGGCAALSTLPFLSTVVNLELTRSALAAAGDLSGYKALVCVFLHGGNDSFNMLAPIGRNGIIDEYADYFATRTSLALPREQLWPIVNSTDGREFGIHPDMPEVAELYNRGELVFLANVGSLIEPTDKATYQRRENLPLGLFSHADEQRHWQTVTPQSRSQITGWAGRMADMLTDTVNFNPVISMNIAVNHLNVLLTGDGVVPYVVDRNNGARVPRHYNRGDVFSQIITQSIDNLLAQTYSDLLKTTHASLRRNTIDAAINFNLATDSVDLGEVIFPNTSLARELQMVARTIAARTALGQNRQIFFVELGGFDNHASLLPYQSNRLTQVSQALYAFNQALHNLGVAHDVTTFTISDFSRTLTTNTGNGSDHAWGANHMIMGGSVIGHTVYGQYPESLALGTDLEIGRGRLIPTTAVDEYAAELAMWFGMQNDGMLEAVLPNIRNFYATNAVGPPLGIMNG